MYRTPNTHRSTILEFTLSSPPPPTPPSVWHKIHMHGLKCKHSHAFTFYITIPLAVLSRFISPSLQKSKCVAASFSEKSTLASVVWQQALELLERKFSCLLMK
jgi:hypothetical protein